jgi:hypothetical protein
MSRQINLRSLRNHLLGLLLIGFLASAVFGLSLNGRVHASENTTDSVTAYCLEHAPQASATCSDSNFAGSGTTLVQATRNVASYHCTDSSNIADCITQKAKGYIKQAADTNPSSGSAFKSALHTVLDKAGGSMKKAADGTGSLAPESTCLSGACSDEAADPNADCSKDRCDFIKKYVNPFIELLSAIFGLIAVISLIMAGIQYSTAGGDSQAVNKAKKRIVNTVLAVVVYFFLYAFLQFIVPGGIFNK